MEAYKVYVKSDGRGYITAVNSSEFVSGQGWAEIDEGLGDRYHHAQANYFPKPLMTEGGAWRYLQHFIMNIFRHTTTLKES